MKKQSLTIADIRSGYSEAKRLSDKSDIWLYFVIRPISFHPTWLFVRLGISANKVTLVGLVIGIVGGVFLAFGSYWAAILGALLINVRFLFDVIDGNVARCTNSCTKYGHYLDAFSTYIMIVLMPITIGIGVYNHPDPYLNYLSNFLFGMNVNSNIYLMLGISGALFSIFGELVTSSLSAVFSMKPVKHRPKAGIRRNLWAVIYWLVCGLIGCMRPLLLVAAITKSLGIFLFLWVLLFTGDFIFLATRALITAPKTSETLDG